MKNLKIGVIGYSRPSIFDVKEAERMINEAYDSVEKQYPGYAKTVVSGLTDIGINYIAYREAQKRGWRTVGIACKKAYNYRLFPVDEKIITGESWGDESPVFLNDIDMLIRVGGGRQSLHETSEAKASGKAVIEYDLPRQN